MCIEARRRLPGRPVKLLEMADRLSNLPCFSRMTLMVPTRVKEKKLDGPFCSIMQLLCREVILKPID